MSAGMVAAQEISVGGDKLTTAVSNVLNAQINKSVDNILKTGFDEGAHLTKFTAQTIDEVRAVQSYCAEQGITISNTGYQINGVYVLAAREEDAEQIREAALENGVSLNDYSEKRQERMPDGTVGTSMAREVLNNFGEIAAVVNAINVAGQWGANVEAETGRSSTTSVFTSDREGGNPTMNTGGAEKVYVVGSHVIGSDGREITGEMAHAALEQAHLLNAKADYILGQNDGSALSFSDRMVLNIDKNSSIREVERNDATASHEQKVVDVLNEQKATIREYEKTSNPTLLQQQEYEIAQNNLNALRDDLGLDIDKTITRKDFADAVARFEQKALDAEYDLRSSVKGRLDAAELNALTAEKLQDIGVSQSTYETVAAWTSQLRDLSAVEKNAEAIKEQIYTEVALQPVKGESRGLSKEYENSLNPWDYGDIRKMVDEINADTVIREKVAGDMLAGKFDTNEHTEINRVIEENNMRLSDLISRSDEMGELVAQHSIDKRLSLLDESDAKTMLQSAIDNGQLSYEKIMANPREVDDLFKAHTDSIAASCEPLIASARQVKADYKELAKTQKQLQNQLQMNPNNREALAAQLEEINRKMAELKGQQTNLTLQIADNKRKIAEFNKQAVDVNRQIAIAQADKELVDKAKTAFKTDKLTKNSVLDELKASGLTKGLNIGESLTYRDLFTMSDNFVEACSSCGIRVTDRWGRFDENLFKRLTSKQKEDLRKLGFDVNNKKLQLAVKSGLGSYGAVNLKNLGAGAFKFGRGFVGGLVKQSDSDGFDDVQKLGSTVYQGGTYGVKAVKTVHKTSSAVRESILARYMEKHPEKAAELRAKQEAKKAKETAKKNVKAGDSNGKLRAKNKKAFMNTEKHANGALAKMSQALMRAKNFAMSLKAVKVIADLLSNLNAVVLAVKGAIAAALAAYFGVALKIGLTAGLVFIVLNVVVALTSSVGGLFNVANWVAPATYSDTVAYNLYTILAKQENTLYRDLTQSYYMIRQNENDINFGYANQAPEKYVETLKNDKAGIYNLEYATVDGVQGFYPNPFYWNGYVTNEHNQKYLTKTAANMYTGTVDYNLTTNLNSFNLISDPAANPTLPPENVDNGHTSNIKDIIAMVDIMYQTETDEAGAGDDALNSILGKSPAQYEAEHIADVISTFFSNVFKAVGNFFTKLFTGEGEWTIEPLKCKTVSYKTVQNYAMTLFEASHQKSYYLSVQYGEYQDEYGNRIYLTNSNGDKIYFDNGTHSNSKTTTKSDIPENPETSMEFGICSSPTTTDFRIMLDMGNNNKPEPYIPKYDNVTYDKQLLNKNVFEVNISTEKNIPHYSATLNSVDKKNKGNEDFGETYYNDHKDLSLDNANSYWCLWDNMPKESDEVKIGAFENADFEDLDGKGSEAISTLAGGIQYALQGSAGKQWWDKIKANESTSATNKAEITKCWVQKDPTDYVKLKKLFKVVSGAADSGDGKVLGYIEYTEVVVNSTKNPFTDTFIEQEIKAHEPDVKAALETQGNIWKTKYDSIEDVYMICGFNDVFYETPEGKAIEYHFDKKNVLLDGKNYVYPDGFPNTFSNDSEFVVDAGSPQKSDDPTCGTEEHEHDSDCKSTVPCSHPEDEECNEDCGGTEITCGKDAHSHIAECYTYTHTAKLKLAGECEFLWANLEITTKVRECKKHTFEYCGGHIGIVNNLNVFSITNEQLALSGSYDDGLAPIALNTEANEPYSTALMSHLSPYWTQNFKDEDNNDITPIRTRYGNLEGKVKDGQKSVTDEAYLKDKPMIIPGVVDYSTAQAAKTSGGGVTPAENIYQGTFVSKGLNILVKTTDKGYSWDSGIGIQQDPLPYTPSGTYKCTYCGTLAPATDADGNAIANGTKIKCPSCGTEYTVMKTATTSDTTSGSTSGSTTPTTTPTTTGTVAKVDTAIDQCRDIFDIDCCILKGDNIFNCKTFRDYAGWTANNMELVCNRFALDWYDVYGFDISQEMGYSNSRLSAQDIELLIYGIAVEHGWVTDGLKFEDSNGKKTDDPLNRAKMVITDVRLQAIYAALINVGRGHSYFPQGTYTSKYNDGYNNYGKMLGNDYDYLSRVRVSDTGVSIDGETTLFSASSTTGSMLDFYSYIQNYVNYLNGKPTTSSYGIKSLMNAPTKVYSFASLDPGGFIVHDGGLSNYKLKTTLFGNMTVDGAVLKDVYANEQAVMYLGSLSSNAIGAMREYYVAHFYNNGSSTGEVDESGKTTKKPEDIMKDQENFLNVLFIKDSSGNYTGFKLSIFTNGNDCISVDKNLYIDFSQVSAFSGVALRYKPAPQSDIANSNWYSYDSKNPYDYLDIADQMQAKESGKIEYYKARGEAVFNYIYPWVVKDDGNYTFYNMKWA